MSTIEQAITWLKRIQEIAKQRLEAHNFGTYKSSDEAGYWYGVYWAAALGLGECDPTPADLEWAIKTAKELGFKPSLET